VTALFFDTSALLPYYRTEARTLVIADLLAAQQRAVMISHLAVLEFASALARWVRMENLTEPAANRIESAFHEDVVSGRFRVLPLQALAVERAHHWLLTRQTSLRTLDALHLAHAEIGGGALVTLDDRQFESAVYWGVAVRPILQ
jgi:uncharacterized protein